jgi:hypothetical protein
VTEQRTINAAYYSKLHTDWSVSTFRSKRRGRSAKSVSYKTTHSATPLLWQQEHCRKCTEKCCHTPPIVLTWRQRIFTCSAHRKRPWEERDVEPMMKLSFLCNDGGTSNHELFWRRHNEATRVMATAHRASGRMCRNIGYHSLKQISTSVSRPIVIFPERKTFPQLLCCQFTCICKCNSVPLLPCRRRGGGSIAPTHSLPRH